MSLPAVGTLQRKRLGFKIPRNSNLIHILLHLGYKLMEANGNSFLGKRNKMKETHLGAHLVTERLQAAVMRGWLSV